MDINLNLGEWNTVFAIPTSVVDKHLKTASSVYLKVLLTVLRNSGTRLNTAQVAQLLSVTEDEVTEALRYWEQSGILSFGTNEGMRVSNTTQSLSKPGHISSIEIAKLMEAKPELRFMFERLESIYGRPVTSTEQRSYIYLYDAAGMPADVLVMIAEHCVSMDKSSIRYIEKTALAWADEGIDTHEKAVARISELSKYHQLEYQIKKHFGIDNRNLSSKEKKYIIAWSEELQFDIEMIRLGYDRMVDGAGRLSFPYLDRILRNWHENQLKTVADVLAQESLFHNSKQNTDTEDSSIDIAAFEKLGLNIPVIEPEE
ncbi:MAG: DnaD domain protein [Oscillospiraceae bacterium]|nr:DnaD domain protein [Oscillospiraceae bacterium]